MSGECQCGEHALECKCFMNPYHYKGDGMQAVDVIEAFHLNFNLGNAIKYILRCEKKNNKKQDLEKALWYIQREIDGRT